MKIIYETGWNNAEFPEELSYDDPTGDKHGQYVVVPLYAFEEDELKELCSAIHQGVGIGKAHVEFSSWEEYKKAKGWDK